MQNAIVVIPARNEQETVGRIVLEAVKHATNVLVVDDDSSDDTKELARHAGARVLELSPAAGYSGALLAGCRYGVEAGYSTVLMLDADGAHDPADIPRILAAHESRNADLTIGSRFDGCGAHYIPSTKLWANYFATKLTNRLIGTSVADVACGFRVLGDRYCKVLLEYGPMRGFSLAFYCIALAFRRGFQIESSPVSVRYDATELACTYRDEFLDFLLAAEGSNGAGQELRDEIRRLKKAVEGMAAITIRIGGETLCLHPISADAYVFQRQPSFFHPGALGTLFDLDSAFDRSWPVKL